MQFFKMQSLGNDFVVIDGFDKEIDVKKLSNRHFGIGCDQLMMVINKSIDGLDLKIFNQDGSVADMCGNGLRCIAGKYFDENPGKESVQINILPKRTVVTAKKQANNLVKICMGKPSIANDIINVGNNHKIFNIDCGNLNDSTDILDFLSHKADHKPDDNFNKNYIHVKGDTVYVVTIERGVGETLACGSGSMASAFSAITNGLIMKGTIKIVNRGSLTDNSPLFVSYENEKIYLTGEYKYVFQGNI